MSIVAAYATDGLAFLATDTRAYGREAGVYRDGFDKLAPWSGGWLAAGGQVGHLRAVSRWLSTATDWAHLAALTRRACQGTPVDGRDDGGSKFVVLTTATGRPEVGAIEATGRTVIVPDPEHWAFVPPPGMKDTAAGRGAIDAIAERLATRGLTNSQLWLRWLSDCWSVAHEETGLVSLVLDMVVVQPGAGAYRVRTPTFDDSPMVKTHGT